MCLRLRKLQLKTCLTEITVLGLNSSRTEMNPTVSIKNINNNFQISVSIHLRYKNKLTK
ncbi:hypothetical protein TUM4438_37600 [Shewanella sairae]|uniref:Uncharacterized protein n=1 Tax=Shewanella sairae TaxID=190310 RepID=A0ABQ4PPH8_9GAMM|nr:hypothetical protein TUM4438_37600 [Shewanella sairae]